jgi:hypothetical protein
MTVRTCWYFSVYNSKEVLVFLRIKMLEKMVYLSVPDNKSRNIPEVVLVRRWTVGVLGIWRGGVGWLKGGANGVSLQAT